MIKWYTVKHTNDKGSATWHMHKILHIDFTIHHFILNTTMSFVVPITFDKQELVQSTQSR